MSLWQPMTPFVYMMILDNPVASYYRSALYLSEQFVKRTPFCSIKNSESFFTRVSFSKLSITPITNVLCLIFHPGYCGFTSWTSLKYFQYFSWFASVSLAFQEQVYLTVTNFVSFLKKTSSRPPSPQVGPIGS